MPSETALAQLSTRVLDGARTRPLPRGRAWCLFDGEHLATDDHLAADLSELLRPIAAQVFPNAAPKFLDLVSGPDRLAQRTSVAVLRAPGGRVGGMVSYVAGEWGGERCFYAASAFIRPEEQGSGLVASGYGMLMRSELVRAPLRPMFAVVRTPNPVAYAAWRQGGRKMGGDVEPGLDLSVSEEARRVALGTAAANGFGSRVDPATLVVHGAYEGAILPGGEGPYGARPRSGDAELDALFDRLLGPEDAIMVVGRMSLHRAAAMAGDRAVRQRLGRIGGRRRGAVVVPSVHTHARVRGADRRLPNDRRDADRRADDRRGHERRALDRRAHDRRSIARSSVERRAPERRSAERRIEPRRAAGRRGPDRRDLERRSGPRRGAVDRRDAPPPA